MHTHSSIASVPHLTKVTQSNLPLPRRGFPMKSLLLLPLLVLSSCASRTPVTAQEALVARSFTPPRGKALLYVYKRASITGGYAGRPVFINRQYIGKNGNGCFMAIPLTPGHYQIQAAAMAQYHDGSETKDYPEIALTAESGKTYFIRQAAEGSGGRTELMPVSTGTGTIVLPSGGGPGLSATLMNPAIGRADCSQLKQIGVEAKF